MLPGSTNHSSLAYSMLTNETVAVQIERNFRNIDSMYVRIGGEKIYYDDVTGLWVPMTQGEHDVSLSFALLAEHTLDITKDPFGVRVSFPVKMLLGLRAESMGNNKLMLLVCE